MKYLKTTILFPFFCTLMSCSTMNHSDSKPNLANAAEYNVQLGLAYLEKHNTTMAKQKLLTAMSQAPKWPVALDAMAYFLEATGDSKEAEVYYLKALKLAPNDGAAMNNYGAFLCRNQRYKDAEAYFLKAGQEINYINAPEALENAGLCALGMNNTPLAQQYFLKAFRQDPSRLASMFELAKIYYRQNHLKEAAFYINRYNAMSTPDAEALWLGIEIARRTGDLDNVGKYGLSLERNFPHSKEFKYYLKMQS